jgi:hypothetical protein
MNRFAPTTLMHGNAVTLQFFISRGRWDRWPSVRARSPLRCGLCPSAFVALVLVTVILTRPEKV